MDNHDLQMSFLQPGGSKQVVVVLVSEDRETDKLQRYRIAALVTSITSLLFCTCCCFCSLPAIILSFIPKSRNPGWPEKRARKYYVAAIVLASIAMTLGTVISISFSVPIVWEKILLGFIFILRSLGVNVVGA